MALAFFDEDDDNGPPSPPSPPNNNYPRPLSLHEELESFDSKLRGSVSAEGSFSSSDDDPELLACLQRGDSLTTPEEMTGGTPDPFNDSAMDDEWDWDSSKYSGGLNNIWFRHYVVDQSNRKIT